MNYLDFINIYLGSIIYLLEREWIFIVKDNLNEYQVKLRAEGFIVIEETRFNATPLLDNGKTKVSPEFIIDLLLYNINSFIKGNSVFTNASIETLARNIPENEIYNKIHFIELVTLLNNIHRNYYSLKNENGTNDLSYIRLKQLLSDLGSPNSFCIKSEIINLQKLSYEEVANLNSFKPELARKIEQLYKINLLLINYLKSYLIINNYHLNISSPIKIEDYKIGWADFLACIEYFNTKEKDEQNRLWLKEMILQRKDDIFKLTDLGLQKIIAPGSLDAIQALRLYKKNN